MSRYAPPPFVIKKLSHSFPDFEIKAEYLFGPTTMIAKQKGKMGEEYGVILERKQCHELQQDLLAPLAEGPDTFITNLIGSKLWLHLEDTNVSYDEPATDIVLTK